LPTELVIHGCSYPCPRGAVIHIIQYTHPVNSTIQTDRAFMVYVVSSRHKRVKSTDSFSTLIYAKFRGYPNIQIFRTERVSRAGENTRVCVHNIQKHFMYITG